MIEIATGVRYWVLAEDEHIVWARAHDTDWLFTRAYFDAHFIKETPDVQ